MKVLVCGGRDFDDRELVFRVLDRLHAWRKIEYIVHGGARGADSLAQAWSDELGVAWAAYEADWDQYGVGAGPIRNALMLRDSKPDLVVAFPGGRGTKDMVERARKVTAVIQVLTDGYQTSTLAPNKTVAKLATEAAYVILGAVLQKPDFE